MITDIDVSANLYVLLPVTKLGEISEIVEVGGIAVMKELSEFITDEDIVATTGMTGDRCMVLVKKSREECMDLVQKAKDSLDAFLKEPDDVKL